MCRWRTCLRTMCRWRPHLRTTCRRRSGRHMSSASRNLQWSLTLVSSARRLHVVRTSSARHLHVVRREISTPKIFPFKEQNSSAKNELRVEDGWWGTPTTRRRHLLFGQNFPKTAWNEKNGPGTSKICLCRSTTENYSWKVRFDVSNRGIILTPVYCFSIWKGWPERNHSWRMSP